MSEISLATPVEELPGVGLARAQRFHQLGIETVQELLYFAPRGYLDYSQILPMSAVRPGLITVQGWLARPPRLWRKGRRAMVEAYFQDGTGQIRAMWFNQSYRAKQLVEGQKYVISGELKFYGQGYSLSQPAVEKIESERLSTGVIVARYPSRRGLDSRTIRRIQKTALSLISEELEIYPADFVSKQGLIPLKDALGYLHFPKSSSESELAQERLSFDELFAMALAARESQRLTSRKKSQPIKFNLKLIKSFLGQLKFDLTDAQRVAAWEIFKDLDSTKPMNRLLEGDVGSGKTVVAAMALLLTVQAGLNGVLLAPTTILASQHFTTLQKALKPFDVKVHLLTRHTKAKSRAEISKTKSIIVATHAVLSDKLALQDIGLVVIDEQHRFGVDDREKIQARQSLAPHVLTMTATPIPRSLALTLYGELDISIINTLPKGRQVIDTTVYPWPARSAAYELLRKQLVDGAQAYIVAPKIIGEQAMSIEKISQELPKLLPGVSFKNIHGRMKNDEKEAIMNDFYNGKISVLLGTTVVEVGVDNPNAAVMIVEAAESFGLAQLHQLRGRVGRGKAKSYCFLITSENVEPTRRLNAMRQTNDGFKLAALDLKLRGPGALYGTRQHGPLELNFADITDSKLLARVARSVAEFVRLGHDKHMTEALNKRVLAFTKATYLN